MSVLTWWGHSAFKIETGGVNILIDPFFAAAGGKTWRDAGKIDLVLVTHDHGDHVGDAVEICRETGADLGCVVGTAGALAAKGVPERQILNGIGFNIGGEWDYRGVKIIMTQAFHSSDSGVPVGYVLKLIGGPVIYHAGDTGIFSTMNLLGKIYDVSLALLPIGGVFTMDALQAAYACELLACQKVAPMHWGTFPVLAQNTDEFKKRIKEICPACAVIDAKPGIPILLEI